MKKKVLSLLLVAAMGISMLVGCGSGDKDTDANAGGNTQAGGDAAATTDVKLTVWAPENQQELLATQAEEFKAAHPEWNLTFEFGIVGEDVAKTEILKDVEAAADVFFFANDQIQELVSAGAIAKLGGDAEAMVNSEMAESVVTTVKVDGSIYAIPFTHNTFYMYYDKSIMTEEDIKSLDTIMAKDSGETEDGKPIYNFLFDGAGGWKLGAWYYGAGCSVYGIDGNDTAAGSNWNNEAGVAVTKYLADMHASDKLAVGLDVTELISNHQLGAWFGGSWELDGFKQALGDDLGMATIPTFGLNGEQVQMLSFYGSKAIGVNAKSANPAAAVAFATFLGSEAQQVARFEQTQIVPANIKAAEADAVKSDEAAVVLMEESNNCAIMQPYSADFSADFWDPCSALCDALKSKEVTSDNAQEYMDKWVEAFVK